MVSLGDEHESAKQYRREEQTMMNCNWVLPAFLRHTSLQPNLGRLVRDKWRKIMQGICGMWSVLKLKRMSGEWGFAMVLYTRGQGVVSSLACGCSAVVKEQKRRCNQCVEDSEFVVGERMSLLAPDQRQ